VNAVGAPIPQVFLQGFGFETHKPGTTEIRRYYALFTAQYFVSDSHMNSLYAVFAAFYITIVLPHLHHYLKKYWDRLIITYKRHNNKKWEIARPEKSLHSYLPPFPGVNCMDFYINFL
jgi:hypothetical protein